MAIQYGIYLTAEGNTLRFPVNPQKIKLEYPADNERYNVLSLGEVVQARKPGLAKISWEDGIFPGTPDEPWTLTAGDFQPPEAYLAFISRCKTERLITTLSLDRHREDGSAYHSDTFPVLVENFEVLERGGETGDFYYAIAFTEYRAFQAKTVTIIQDAKTPGAAIAVTQPKREVPKGQLVVNSRVTVNGPFCYDSFGAKPHGSGNGRTAVVGRILTTDPGRAYPVLLKTETGGLLGWCKREVLTILS